MYECQKTRSLFDLCPRSLRFILSNIFCSKAPRPVEAKFHVELLLVVGMKVCSNGPCHMTKMAAKPFYGKNPLKIFFSETSRPRTFELGIQHQELGFYTACSNDGPGLTLTFFTARLTLLPNAFVWENT